MRENESGLTTALEAALKAASEPMDAVALFDLASIKPHAPSANRVSDYLGLLWRRNLVTRLPAPKDNNSRTKWMYEWKGNRGPKIHDHAVEFAPRVLADRPSVLISEDGDVITMEFPNLVIIVKQKPSGVVKPRIKSVT